MGRPLARLQVEGVNLDGELPAGAHHTRPPARLRGLSSGRALVGHRRQLSRRSVHGVGGHVPRPRLAVAVRRSGTAEAAVQTNPEQAGLSRTSQSAIRAR
jgi:hypothetical protein